MSGRIDEYYEWEGDGQPPWLWDANVRRALAGIRGLAVLRDLEAALLALPEPRLAFGAACKVKLDDDDQPAGTPTFCVVGAFLRLKRLARGEDEAAIVAQLSDSAYSAEDGDYGYEVLENIANAAKRLTRAFTFTLAYKVQSVNDANDEEDEAARYQRVLAWVRNAIDENEFHRAAAA